MADLVRKAQTNGDANRGLLTFASATTACLSCHKIGEHGGGVGPNLTEIGRQRTPEQLVESVLWPQREVKPEFQAHRIVTADGRSHQGYLVGEDQDAVVLRDPSRPADGDRTIALDEIDARRRVGSLMPDNLLATMTATDRDHLFRFLFGLGREEGPPAEEVRMLMRHALAHVHGPADFEFKRAPLVPENWPNWESYVNRDRIYDFYAKQAEHFRRQSPTPPLLPEFPGLDGGQLGHWGNQNEQVWASDRWNSTLLGSVQCGVFRGAGVVVPRGVCVRLGDKGELSACFNPQTLTYDAVWRDGFVKRSSVRHGFMHGLMIDGQALPKPTGRRPSEPFVYHGFYRSDSRVVFAYRIGDEEYLDSPWVEEGRFVRVVAPRDKHPLRDSIKNPSAQWPRGLTTPVDLPEASADATTRPYVVDTIHLPTDNPWKALLFCSGHDFLPDGSALVCTMQGDVWHVSGFDFPSRQATWRRFAAGLHQPQGLVVGDDGIFVLGRDQLTRLHDLNGDNEADFYECFSNVYETSPAGHDFICGLQRDADGCFYTASGNQGLVRISRDGQTAEVLATGFRNPDGLGVLDDGTVTVPCSEGSWTPATMICEVQPDHGLARNYFGYGGPRNAAPPQLPLLYIPRGIDNSAGGQIQVNSERWGPLNGQILHFSFGTGAHFLVLRDRIDGQSQGGLVPLAGEFLSGVHRGRFRKTDGQLYVTGMQGWGSYTPDDGCFQRVRYVNQTAQLPVGFHVYQNGVRVDFSEPVDRQTVETTTNHFAQCWNYRYSAAYGSPEFSAIHANVRGHDSLAIASAHALPDSNSLFLEIPELQPVNQLHLYVRSAQGKSHELFLTVHKMDAPFEDFPGYRARTKPVRPHPILADLALATRKVPNPHRRKIAGAREVVIETGTNLSFVQREVRVKAGEPLALTLVNPDVVPHNWALAKPGTLGRVGKLANQLISDPEAILRQYVPETSDVLAYTDVVLPRDRFTIYFHAPKQPGRYPYLCTFPGHWLVMNGEMIVESP